MSERERDASEETPAGDESETLDTVWAPPVRDRLASALDKASIAASLFGAPAPTVRIDRFTLLEQIGRGAMGEVYAAYDERLDRKVAIKLVARSRPEAIRADDRLLREARTMAQLSHPNVAQVHEVGTYDGRVYIAMEYVRGQTLRAWLAAQDERDGARGRAVLRRFIEAGRGLEAAHAQGLVHRDFKPDNVLVGEDGRPRVVDFGLARLVTDDDRRPSDGGDGRPGDDDGDGDDGDGSDSRSGPTNGAPARRIASTEDQTLPPDAGPDAPPAHSLKAAWVLTERGQIMGTPRYMSPEQWRGERADHRSDQFSFCVALWEALAGQPPFAGRTGSDFVRAADDPERAATVWASPEPPRTAGVRASVFRALRRGLSADPDDRFSDMGELLAALDAQPRRRRSALAAVAIIAAGAAGWMLASPGAADPCARAGTSIDAVWTAQRRASVGETFARAGVPDAGQTWTQVAALLDDYADRWRAGSAAACRATHVRREQPEPVYELRTACLWRARARFAALVDGFERADRAAVLGAAAAAADLPELAACDDVDTLRMGAALPDRSERGIVAEIRAQLAAARTQELLGHRDVALSLADAADAAIAARSESGAPLRYAPVRAEVAYQRGRLLALSGADAARGEALLHEATNLAHAERHDDLVADALNFLVLSALRNHDTTARGHALSARAMAAVRRAGDLPQQRAEALRYRGLLLARDGDIERAEASQRQALDVLASDPDTPWLLRAVHLADLADTVRDRRAYDDARALYERARALYARLGDSHPYVGDVRFNMGVLAMREGDVARARAAFEDALRIRRGARGAEHPDVGAVHLALANLDQRAGALAAAEAHAEAGVRIYRAAYDADDARLADAYQVIGAIRYRRGEYGGARDAYREALVGLVARVGGDDARVGYAHANLAEAELALGDHAAALDSIERARRVLVAGRDGANSEPLMDAFLDGVRGRALLGLGRAREAVDALRAARERFGAPGAGNAPLERAAVHWALARALAALDRGKSARARAEAAEARRWFERGGDAGQAGADAVRQWLGAGAPR